MNEYNSPAQLKQIDTYSPIPFDMLYRLGASAKADVDEAIKNTSSTLDKWSTFKSASQKDTDTWYNETVGRAMPVINEMSTNMDLLKSAEGRARLNSAINNVDRSKMANLTESAEQLKTRQKLDQEMMIRGIYNPDWHKVDYNNYDTSKQGVFNDMSPIGYKDINEIASPYFKDVTPRYLGTKRGMQQYGVSQDDVLKAAKQSFNDIYNTPEAQMHMKVYMQKHPEATAAQAKENLYKEVVTSQMPKAKISNLQADPIYMERMREASSMRLMAAKAAAKGGNGQGGQFATITDKIRASGNKLYEQRFSDLITPTTTNESLRKSVGIRLEQGFRAGAGQPVNGRYDSSQEKRGTEQVLNMLSTKESSAGAKAVLTASGGVPNAKTGEYLMNSSNLILPNQFVNDVRGSKVKNDAFAKAFKGGRMNNISVQPTDRIVIDPHSQHSYYVGYANIPMSEFRKSGVFSNQAIANDTYRRYGISNVMQDNKSNSVSVHEDSTGNLVTTSGVSGKNNQHTMKMKVLIPIPSQGSAKEEVDRYYDSKTLTPGFAAKQAGEYQDEAYNYLLNQ